jgi:DNA-binding FadR family transcriptional regulator
MKSISPQTVTKPKAGSHALAAGTQLTPLRRMNLVEEVVARLGRQIVSGDLAPGQSLAPEGQLSLEIGVSRTVVREAMRILGERGLVEVSQGRPPRVKPADPAHVVTSLSTFLQRGDHSLLHLIEVRCPLEARIAAIAAQRATPDQLAAMEQANRHLAEAKKLDDRIEADLRFHDLLAESTGNPVFGLLLSPLANLMRLSRRQTLGRTGAERAAAGHEKILAAVRRGDADAAGQAMLEHLAMAKQDLVSTGLTDAAAT